MFQNGQTERQIPERLLADTRRRMRYVEWRSLFVAKRNQIKKNRITCDFSTLFLTLEFAKSSNFLIHLPFCVLDFFNISFEVII